MHKRKKHSTSPKDLLSEFQQVNNALLTYCSTPTTWIANDISPYPFIATPPRYSSQSYRESHQSLKKMQVEAYCKLVAGENYNNWGKSELISAFTVIPEKGSAKNRRETHNLLAIEFLKQMWKLPK